MVKIFKDFKGFSKFYKKAIYKEAEDYIFTLGCSLLNSDKNKTGLIKSYLGKEFRIYNCNYKLKRVKIIHLDENHVSFLVVYEVVDLNHPLDGERIIKNVYDLFRSIDGFGLEYQNGFVGTDIKIFE